MTAKIGLFALVSNCYGQTFTVSVSAPSALTIYPGQQNVPVTVTVSPSAYTGPIGVTLTGLPSGITVSPLTLTAGNSGSLMLKRCLQFSQPGRKVFRPMTVSYGSAHDWTAAVTGCMQQTPAPAVAQRAPLCPDCFHFQSCVCSGSRGYQPADREPQYEWCGDREQDNRSPRHHHHHFSRRPSLHTCRMPPIPTTRQPFICMATQPPAMPKLPYHVKLNTEPGPVEYDGARVPLYYEWQGQIYLRQE